MPAPFLLNPKRTPALFLITFLAIGCADQIAQAQIINIQAGNAQILTHQLPLTGDLAAVQLLRDFRVLRELKCTLVQRETIEDALDALDDSIAEHLALPAQIQINALPGGADAGDATGVPAENPFEKQQQETAQVGKQLREETLTARQKARLDQIELRLHGPLAFQLPAVVKSLQLTRKQQELVERTIIETLRELQERSQAEFGGPGSGIRVFTPLNGRDMAPTLEEGVDSIVEDLTAKQKKTWESLVGEELQNIPKTSLFPSPGGAAGATAFLGQGIMIQGNAAPALPLRREE